LPFLNAEDWRTTFGRPFTWQHVEAICGPDGIAQGPGHTQPMLNEDLEKIQ
jgi:hypothetical protein